jgi:hypothetical protein
MLKKLYKVATKRTQVYEWHKHFRGGSAGVNDDPCCQPPLTLTNVENIQHVCIGFQKSFQKLYKCWQNFVIAQGNYFEGNVV